MHVIIASFVSIYAGLFADKAIETNSEADRALYGAAGLALQLMDEADAPTRAIYETVIHEAITRMGLYATQRGIVMGAVQAVIDRKPGDIDINALNEVIKATRPYLPETLLRLRQSLGIFSGEMNPRHRKATFIPNPDPDATTSPTADSTPTPTPTSADVLAADPGF